MVATDQPMPAARVWNVPAPTAEGMYLLEVRSSWDPIADSEGTRLGRWLRRRRYPTMATSSVRRLTLAVIGPNPSPSPVRRGEGRRRTWTVLDLARLRGYRPMASGRSPLPAPGGDAWAVPEAALVEPTRRDRLRGWITRVGSEAANLARADAAGLAWSAIGLKVPHPDRPHRLTVTVTGGHPVGAGRGAGRQPGEDAAGRPRIVLDACASGPPILQDGPPASFSWLVWPDAAEPVLVLVNRDADATVQLGTVTLTELAELPAAPGDRTARPRVRAEPRARTWPGPNAAGPLRAAASPDPADLLASARNLAQYLAYCGASVAVLPEALADRPRRRALDGQAGEDAIGPDRLDLLLRVLGRQGCAAWLELAFDGPLPGLPAPDSAEALARGLVRVDRRGLPDGPAYHPLHPEVRGGDAAPGRRGGRVAEGPGRPADPARARPDPAGEPRHRARRRDLRAVRPRDVRPRGRAGRPRPEPERPEPVRRAGPVPRRLGPDALADLAVAWDRLALRRAGRDGPPRRAGATLAVATPGLDAGPAGLEARRVDLAGLDPNHAWRTVGLDLETWPAGESAPIVLRGVGLSADALAHDLATSPELDAKVAARADRGLLLAAPEARPRRSSSRSRTRTGIRARDSRGTRDCA